jgi:hypothetical protein
VALSSGGGSVLVSPVTVFQQWTRLIRFVAAETSQVHIGQPVDPQLDSEATYLTGVCITNLCYVCISPVGLAVANEKKRVFAHEILGSPFDPAAQLTKNVLSVKTLLSPLSREQIGLARCLGLNYADHAVRKCASGALPRTDQSVLTDIANFRLRPT